MLTKFDKTLAALLVSGAVPVLAYFTGVTIDPAMQALAVTALTSLFVYLVPNKGVAL